MFVDRHDAGAKLGNALAAMSLDQPVVLGLPRGGVVVAAAVAKALTAPLDVVIVRKIGAPRHPELAAGALVDGDPPQLVRNDDVVRAARIDSTYLDAEVQRQTVEIQRRRALYQGGRPRIPLAGRTVVLVDDGIATGATVRAALQAVQAAAPGRLILAVPVAPPETVASLAPLCDEVACLEQPARFMAVGQFYRNFEQTTDAEVVTLLNEVRTAP
jgi:putative phosphoribosyl transferase